MKRFPATILLAALLLAGIVSTGTALVTTTHETRALFREREALRREEDRLRGDWSALQLEVSTLTDHAKLLDRARDDLDMVEPGQNLRYVEVGR